MADTARLLRDPAGGRPLRLGILAFWTAMGLVESSKAYVSFQLREIPRTWADVLIGNMPWWYVWAILTPLIFALAMRFRLDRGGWRRAVAYARRIMIHGDDDRIRFVPVEAIAYFETDGT